MPRNLAKECVTDMCVMCEQRRPNVILLECRCRSNCEDCASDLIGRGMRCQTCRAHVDAVHRDGDARPIRRGDWNWAAWEARYQNGAGLVEMFVH